MPELSNDIASRQAQAASDLDQLKPEEKYAEKHDMDSTLTAQSIHRRCQMQTGGVPVMDPS